LWGSLGFFESQDAPRVLGVIDEGDPRQPRKGLLEELQALAVFGADERDPGDVAARARVARNEARPIGERHVGEHDRDRGRRPLGRLGGLRARGAEHLDRTANQLSRELRQTLGVPLGPADLDGDVLTLDVPELSQASLKGLQIGEALGGRGRR
jgi:hypothetical protein